MKKLQTALSKLPEYYFILLAIAAGYSPPAQFNPLFLTIIAVLVLQILFANRKFGMSIGVIFFFGNLFFLGALISEFNEFSDFNNSAFNLLLVGLILWIINSILATKLVYKYLTDHIDKSIA